MIPTKNHLENIEQLRERYDELHRKKITAEANLETSSQSLENLKKQARDKYGTDDLTVLQAKLQEMTAENDRKVAEYRDHVSAIETGLKEVETQHAEAARKEAQT